MKSLAAGGLDEGRQTRLLQPFAHFLGGRDHGAPGHPVAWIEVERDRVGMVEIRVCRAPRVDFEHRGLHQPD